MWKPIGIADLIFYQELSSHIKRKFCAYISWNSENQIELYRTMLLFSFQKSSVNCIKVLGTFYKNYNSGYLKTKTIFVNPDEHEY